MTAENVVPLRTAPRIDRPRAERAVTELLAALGYPVEGEHRAMTPQRVASAFAEMLTPSAFLPTTFGNDEGYDELVVAREVPFRSLCEHHLLPFYGHAHVAYIPNESIVGLSKMARIVEFYARRPQLQERLTEQIARYMAAKLDPQGVMVVIEARHLCVEMRGIKKPGALTVTSAIRGIFNTQRVREEFLDLLNRGKG